MSRQARDWAWTQPIQGGPKFVLVTLADISQDGRTAWPSMATLAERCGYPDRTLRRHIHELQSLGLISIAYRHNGAGHRVGCIYTLNLPANMASSGDELPANMASSEQKTNSLPANMANLPANMAAPEQVTEPEGKKKIKNPPAPLPPPDADIPAWCPADAWQGWEVFCSEMERPLSATQRRLHLKALKALVDEGQDATEVVEKAIRSGWREFYPVKGAPAAVHGNRGVVSSNDRGATHDGKHSRYGEADEYQTRASQRADAATRDLRRRMGLDPSTGEPIATGPGPRHGADQPADGVNIRGTLVVYDGGRGS